MLTEQERRIHEQYEAAREAAAIGPVEDAILCEGCSAEMLDGDNAQVLLGVTYCPACALGEAARLVQDSMWPSRDLADRLDILDVLGTAVAKEEATLRGVQRLQNLARKAVSP